MSQFSFLHHSESMLRRISTQNLGSRKLSEIVILMNKLKFLCSFLPYAISE